MTKPRSRTHSDKFLLTLHPTGQFCKKIRGELYCFGTDKQRALHRYLEQASYLQGGVPPQPCFHCVGACSVMDLLAGRATMTS
jgi:hypothetical protein